MTDIPPQPAQPAASPAAPAGDDLAPPDDFGAELLDVFARREQATAAPADEGGPPGGWPSVDDAAKTATPAPVAGTTPDSSPSDPTASPQVPVQVGDGGTEPAPTPVTPAPAGQPAVPAGAEPAPTPVTDAAEAPIPATSEAPSGYTWRYNDGTADREHTFADADVQRALSLSIWAEGLPDTTRQAIGALETGQAVAVPRADYDQFLAWRNQQDRSTRDADLSQLDVDPDVAKLITSLRDEVAELKAPGTAPAPQPEVDPQLHANLNATAARMQQATVEYAETRGLTPTEVEGLLAQAVKAEVIPAFMTAGAIFHPVTGALIAPADIATVTEQALDFALARNPALHTRALAGQQTPTAPASGTPLPTTPDPVAAKKARAASLATAPSGAVAPPPATVKTMSNEDRVAAMAKEIEAALAAS